MIPYNSIHFTLRGRAVCGCKKAHYAADDPRIATCIDCLLADEYQRELRKVNTFIAGPFTATYGASSIGQVQEGFSIFTTTFVDEIRGDTAGQALQDGAYLGTDRFLQCTLLENDAAGAASMFFPWGADGLVGQVGRLMTAVDAALVLTRVAGTTATPASLTGSQTVLAPNFNPEILISPRLRRTPIRLQFLPYTSGGNIVHYTTT